MGQTHVTTTMGKPIMEQPSPMATIIGQPSPESCYKATIMGQSTME